MTAREMRFCTVLHLRPSSLIAWESNLIDDAHAAVELFHLPGDNEVKRRYNRFAYIFVYHPLKMDYYGKSLCYQLYKASPSAARNRSGSSVG